MKDVNPKVDGLTKLKQAGIEIEFVLEEESKFLNRVFIKNMTQKLPYVVLKTATTMDGKIATKEKEKYNHFQLYPISFILKPWANSMKNTCNNVSPLQKRVKARFYPTQWLAASS